MGARRKYEDRGRGWMFVSVVKKEGGAGRLAEVPNPIELPMYIAAVTAT